MTFKEQMKADAAIFFNQDEFAEEVTYNGIEIVAIADIGEGIRRGQHDNRERSGYFEVRKEDVSNPQENDIIVDSSGNEWFVTEISAEDEISSVLRTVANQSAIRLR